MPDSPLTTQKRVFGDHAGANYLNMVSTKADAGQREWAWLHP
ncbi:MAG: hypothetical protein ACPG8N_08510 [Rhodothermales bacterium]